MTAETPPPLATGRVVGSLVVGVVVGAVGTGIHRLNPPWGVLLALLIVFSAAIMARAWAGTPGVLSLGGGLLLTVAAMAGLGPGGDVVIAAQPVGYAWLAGVLMVGAAGLLPRSWFSDEPIRRRSGKGVDSP